MNDAIAAAKPMTPAECRAAIENLTHEIPFVRNVMMMVRRDGLSAEDAYSVLAYHAITEAARAFDMHIAHLRRCVYKDPIFTKDENERQQP